LYKNSNSRYWDGYAAGYDMTCKIRPIMIEGNCDNKYYFDYYRDVYYRCKKEKVLDYKIN